jgi:phage gp36-like protein
MSASSKTNKSMFLTIEDYKAVVDNKTLEVINQSDPANLARAEGYAIDEISGYLRAARSNRTGIRPYDVVAAFAKTGAARNRQLVMYTVDVALYHLVAWLPQRIGFEIREIRYNQAVEWLKSVQAGKVLLDLELIAEDDPDDAGNSIRWGSWGKNRYEY